MAALPFAAVYTANNLVGWWLVFTYAVFVCFTLKKRKASFRPALPLSISVITLSAVLIGTAVFYHSQASVTAIDVGQGQSIALFGGGGTVLIDCGGTGTWEDAGDTAAEFLLGSGRTRVDVLVLTHLHEDHAGGWRSLCPALT
jgi:competence protein ComEC